MTPKKMNARRRVVMCWAVVCFGALPLVAGCATSTSNTPVSPVTVTVTAQPSSVSSVPPTASTSAGGPLAAEFARLGVPVGVAIAPVGKSAAAPIVLGRSAPVVAWSTIKVPLAVAAQRANGPTAAETNAIINSDNASAEQLWASLGDNATASAAVTGVLREGGDATTVVPSQRLRSGYTIFGQTLWPLSNAATFTAHLPCLPGTEHVVSLMGQVAGNQQWGVEVMAAPKMTAVKGGWGPGQTAGYVVRQIGLITYRDSTMTAIAMSTVGSSMGEGIASLNAVANWLNRNISRLPRGRC